MFFELNSTHPQDLAYTQGPATRVSKSSCATGWMFGLASAVVHIFFALDSVSDAFCVVAHSLRGPVRRVRYGGSSELGTNSVATEGH